MIEKTEIKGHKVIIIITSHPFRGILNKYSATAKCPIEYCEHVIETQPRETDPLSTKRAIISRMRTHISNHLNGKI